MKKTFISAALLVLVVATAHAQPAMRDGVLADASGRTVYTFDKDAPGKSNCSGGCLTAWPAFLAKEGASAKGEFTLIDTAGGKQWAVKGMPLYYFAGDSKPGDRKGEGSGGVWHIVGSAPKAAASAY